MTQARSSEQDLVAYALKTIGPPNPDALTDAEQAGGADLARRALETLNRTLERLRAAAPSDRRAARELHSLLKQVLARHETTRAWAEKMGKAAGPSSPAAKLALG